ncbi:MAG: hypothetical protein PUD07_04915 [bacterium]|nr:hypothetical protein [bacterium]
MEKKNTLLLTVIAVATLLVAVVGATFAYFGSFTTTVDNKAAVNVATEAAKSSTFSTSSASLKLNVAGSEMLKGTGSATQVGSYTGDNANLIVSLEANDQTTTTTCTYDVYFVYDEGSAVYGNDPTPVTAGTDNKEFTYTLKSDAAGLVVDPTYIAETEKDFSVFKTATTAVKVASGTIAASNTTTTQTLTAKVMFYNFPTIDQTALSDKTYGGKFYVEQSTVVCGTTAV